MTTDEVLAVVRRQVREILPDVAEDDIARDRSLRELGANSLDRMDVLVASMEDLDISAPVSDFADVSDIGGLVDALAKRC